MINTLTAIEEMLENYIIWFINKFFNIKEYNFRMVIGMDTRVKI